MSDLHQKKCIPCSSKMPPLKGPELERLAKELNGWKIEGEHHLEKEYKFKNFLEALAFTNAVGAIAEQEGHHPDILLSWGMVKVTFWTHKIGGLSESDFIMASKTDQIKI
ncbi:MAG: 4a-hydroxytetrahydrobiopterin dehydratase [Verrucomicrobia bacterium]|nr:4a-hydroxytetrahydrobiopterin dehydratase [Verrucomicrobiota bacterium]